MAIEHRNPIVDDQRRAGNNMPSSLSSPSDSSAACAWGDPAHHRAHLQFSKGQHAQTRLAFRIQNQAKIEIRLPHLLADGMAIRYL
jgi:hypothetical protein